MNLLEHYINEVISVEDVTNNYHSLFGIITIDEPIYKIKMVVNCYGNKTTEEVIWRKGLYESNIKRGYYLA